MKYVSRKFFRLSFFVFVMPFFFVSGLFADGKYSFDQEQGFESYRKNNWTDAMFFLRKAVASPSGVTSASSSSASGVGVASSCG